MTDSVGGEDVNKRLFDHFAAEMKRKFKNTAWRIDCYKDARIRLLNACEDAKHKLSTETEAAVQLDKLFNMIDFKATINRSFFDGLCFDVFQKAVTLVERALCEARVDCTRKTMESIEENKRKRKLEEQEEQKVYKQCKKTFNWLERNDMRKTEDLQHRLEEAKELNRSFSGGTGS
uniref:Biogenesis of lysosome-related organelles complex 1 subunit 5 n=1 Tax=Panagrellus redivivus TaxID=6233 RepID=A0A7E4ZRP3_PANRE